MLLLVGAALEALSTLGCRAEPAAVAPAAERVLGIVGRCNSAVHLHMASLVDTWVLLVREDRHSLGHRSGHMAPGADTTEEAVGTAVAAAATAAPTVAAMKPRWGMRAG